MTSQPRVEVAAPRTVGRKTAEERRVFRGATKETITNHRPIFEMLGSLVRNAESGSLCSNTATRPASQLSAVSGNDEVKRPTKEERKAFRDATDRAIRENEATFKMLGTLVRE